MCETNELFWQKIPEVAACGQAQRLLNFKELLPASIARMPLRSGQRLLRQAQRSGARLGFCSLPPAPLSGTPALEMSAKPQSRRSWHPCRVGNYGRVLVLCVRLGGCAADVCCLHKCWAVQSLWKSFPGCAERKQPVACSAMEHLKQNTCRSRQLGFGFFQVSVI